MGGDDVSTVTTPSIDGSSSTESTSSSSTTASNPNSGNRNNSNNNNQNRGSRSSKKDQNLAILSEGDKSFKGACVELGIVIGLATEASSLKHGKLYSEFTNGLLVYVQANYTRGNDLRPLIHELKDPRTCLKSKEPVHPEDEDKLDASGNIVTDKEGNPVKKTPSKSEEKKWELKMKKHMEREELLEENIERLFGLVSGQCTQGLLAEIKADKDYDKKADNSDALWLMKTIKTVSAGVDSRANKVFTYHEKVIELAKIQQGPLESIDDYRTKFTSAVKTVEMTGGDGLFHPYEQKDTLGRANERENQKMKDRVLGMWFLLHSDKIRFGGLLNKMKESETLDKDVYPNSVVEAYNILTNQD